MDVSVHCRGVGLDSLQRFLPIPSNLKYSKILQFYNSNWSLDLFGCTINCFVYLLFFIDETTRKNAHLAPVLVVVVFLIDRSSYGPFSFKKTFFVNFLSPKSFFRLSKIFEFFLLFEIFNLYFKDLI